MGGNDRSPGVGEEKQQPEHQDRHDDRQTGNVWQDKGGLILCNGTGPLSNRTSLRLSMTAGLAFHAVLGGKTIVLYLLRKNAC